ncbi:MAG: hypothetical protein HZB25_10240 [Candidatus Eisenbacteria bacterium]|nr:hypothetical protein [Candidatus Eisenbacteria bacterium]
MVVRHRARFLAVVALAVPFAGCSLKAPQAPHWNATLRVPLAEKSLSVADLAEHNSSYLQIDSSGTAAFHWQKDLADVTVGNSLNLPAIGADAQSALGSFQVTPTPPQAIQVALSDIWPQALGVSGQMAPVPALQFAPVQAAQSEGFVSAEVASGTLLVTLRNGLPVPLNSSTLVLANAGGGSLGSLPIPAVAPGESATVALPLDGKSLSSSWTGTWTGSSPGSASPVQVDPAATVRARFAFQGALTVSAAVAPLPAQDYSFNSSGALPDTEALSGADFTAGSLDLGVDNHWGVGGSLRITLPDLTGADGRPLTRTVPVEAARTVQVSFPLGGVRFAAPDPAHPAVRVQGTLESAGTGSRNVTLSSSDVLAVHAALAGATLSRAEGVFAPFRVNFNPVSHAMDLPEGLGPLGLADAGATITLTSTAGVPARVTLNVSGADASGSPWALTGPAGGAITLDLPAAVGGAPATATLRLTGANSNLPDFLGRLPRTVSVTGFADAGDRVHPSSVRSTDTFHGSFEVGSALLASFSDSRVTLSADSVSLSQDTRDQVKDRLVRVRLHATVVNGLPLGADATLYLAASKSEAEDPTGSTVSLAATVGAAGVDPATGVVRSPATSEVLLELSGAQLDVLQARPLYVGGRVHLPGTGSQKVRVRAQDAVSARVWLEAEGKVVR